MPAFSGDESVFYGFYENVGGSPRGMLRTAFTDPVAILSELVSGHVVLYLFLLGVPLAGLFLLAPGLAAVGLPQLALNALADPLGPVDPRQHYLAAIVPFAFAAAAIGVGRLAPRHRVPASVAALTLSVVVSAALGPWSWAPGRTPLWYQTPVSATRVGRSRPRGRLRPGRRSVSASNRVGGHLADRRRLYVLPVVGRAEWIVLDTEDLWLADERLPVLRERTPAEVDALRAKLEADPRWVTVLEEDGVYVFRRRAA